MTLSRLVSGVARRLAVLPIRALDAAARAEAIEQLTERSIATTPAGGTELRFYAPSPLLRSRAAAVLTKEPDTIAWIETFGAGTVLWDIGANVGVFTLYAAAARRCRVLAFEPSAANFFALTRNIDLNAASDRVAAYCLAIAPATELGVINLDSTAIGTAMSQFGKAGDASRYAAGRKPVVQGAAGVTLDDLIARFNAAPPTHIKIDVDGLEPAILRGGSALLKQAAVCEVMVELSLTRHAERQQAVEWLGECGLTLRSQGPPQGAGGEQAANHLFVRR